MAARTTPRRGRPRTSTLSRAEQLRAAKQRQRLRQRDAGLKKVELVLPEEDADRLRVALTDERFRKAARQLLDGYVVDIEAWPGLRELAWNRADRWIPGGEALALYERNWRHLDADALEPRERDLIHELARRFGGGHLDV
jgi:hypothetical protein